MYVPSHRQILPKLQISAVCLEEGLQSVIQVLTWHLGQMMPTAYWNTQIRPKPSFNKVYRITSENGINCIWSLTFLDCCWLCSKLAFKCYASKLFVLKCLYSNTRMSSAECIRRIVFLLNCFDFLGKLSGFHRT